MAPITALLSTVLFEDADLREAVRTIVTEAPLAEGEPAKPLLPGSDAS